MPTENDPPLVEANPKPEVGVDNAKSAVELDRSSSADGSNSESAGQPSASASVTGATETTPTGSESGGQPFASTSGAGAAGTTPTAQGSNGPPIPSGIQPSEAVDWSNEDTTKDKGKLLPSIFPAYHHDQYFFRMVIYFAGWTLILCVGGMLILAQSEKEIPQGVVAASSGLVGLLTGIFAARSGQTS